MGWGVVHDDAMMTLWWLWRHAWRKPNNIEHSRQTINFSYQQHNIQRCYVTTSSKSLNLLTYCTRHKIFVPDFMLQTVKLEGNGYSALPSPRRQMRHGGMQSRLSGQRHGQTHRCRRPQYLLRSLSDAAKVTSYMPKTNRPNEKPKCCRETARRSVLFCKLFDIQTCRRSSQSTDYQRMETIIRFTHVGYFACHNTVYKVCRLMFFVTLTHSGTTRNMQAASLHDFRVTVHVLSHACTWDRAN